VQAPGQQAVLLVEDDSTLREVVAELLRLEGYAVEEAQDGAEAVRALQEHQPPPDYYCGVLLDMMLPQVSGAGSAATAARRVGWLRSGGSHERQQSRPRSSQGGGRRRDFAQAIRRRPPARPGTAALPSSSSVIVVSRPVRFKPRRSEALPIRLARLLPERQASGRIPSIHRNVSAPNG
jgi:CheY-like chemotaxis protein